VRPRQIFKKGGSRETRSSTN